MSDYSDIQKKIDDGDPGAASQLLPLVYDELKRLAEWKMANEPAGHSLQATALVHEAYLRLVDTDGQQAWESRGHFFAAAAEAMRRILVENARKKRRIKHGGGRKRLDLNSVDLADPQNFDILEALDKSIDQLAEQNAMAAQVVNLRFFVGLTIQQTADALGLSVRTANRYWVYAKAWIFQQVMADENPV
jgi:RNA polymerase sigma factor (TIGR02999 family)